MQRIMLLLLITTITECLGIIHNCIEDFVELVKVEEDLIEALRTDISSCGEDLPELRDYMAYFEESAKGSEEDALAYVSNPMNAYFLMKRLVIDWHNVGAFMRSWYFLPRFLLKKVPALLSRKDHPKTIDLDLAILGLARLQFYYNVTSAEMAQGILLGVKYSRELKYEECFLIGEWYFKNELYDYALTWLELANDQFVGEDTNVHVTILELLGRCAHILGR